MTRAIDFDEVNRLPGLYLGHPAYLVNPEKPVGTPIRPEGDVNIISEEPQRETGE